MKTQFFKLNQFGLLSYKGREVDVNGETLKGRFIAILDIKKDVCFCATPENDLNEMLEDIASINNNIDLELITFTF